MQLYSTKKKLWLNLPVAIKFDKEQFSLVSKQSYFKQFSLAKIHRQFYLKQFILV